MNKKKQGELAKQLMTEYPTAGNLTLAKRLFRDYPDYFNSVEHARSIIRVYKGVNGVRSRRKLQDLTHVKDLDKVLRDKFNLPESASKENKPYVLPKANKQILILGDLHFPFQNNNAILQAVEFGIKKQIDCIILNGDVLDLYQISRFTKDGRKPNIDYELDLVYQFLLDLRNTFPNALIIWKFGNHEERWDAYLKTNAPLLNMIGTECLDDVIPVASMNIVVVKDKRRIVAGDLNILHGHEFNSGVGNVNPARSMFLKARVNILVNHFHRSSAHKGRDLNGNITKCWSLGAMCSQQDYSPYGDQDASFGYLQIDNGKTYVTNWEI